MGQIGSKIRDDATPPERELAHALQEMCRCAHSIRRSQSAIAKAVHIAPSTLSEYLSAHRLASRDAVIRLWELTEHSPADRGARTPQTLEDMLRLHTQAALTRRLREIGGTSGTYQLAGPDDSPSAPVATRPAPLNTRRLHRKHILRLLAAKRRRAQLAASVLPVPLRERDRQHDSTTEPVWAGAADVARHLQAGRESDAFTLLWHTGRTHPAASIRNVVAACRIAGLGDAARVVLTSAGTREPESVLRIIESLHDARHYDDATVLARAANHRNI